MNSLLHFSFTVITERITSMGGVSFPFYKKFSYEGFGFNFSKDTQRGVHQLILGNTNN